MPEGGYIRGENARIFADLVDKSLPAPQQDNPVPPTKRAQVNERSGQAIGEINVGGDDGVPRAARVSGPRQISRLVP